MAANMSCTAGIWETRKYIRRSRLTSEYLLHPTYIVYVMAITHDRVLVIYGGSTRALTGVPALIALDEYDSQQ